MCMFAGLNLINVCLFYSREKRKQLESIEEFTLAILSHIGLCLKVGLLSLVHHSLQSFILGGEGPGPGEYDPKQAIKVPLLLMYTNVYTYLCTYLLEHTACQVQRLKNS